MMTVITFIVILAILILVHELGHFVSAIKLGVAVEEFGIGFPPKMFAIKRNGIQYSINWIPLGGFVKIKGESGEGADDPRSFVNQPSWKKLIIISAGVIMNFVLAFILLSAVFMAGFPQEITPEIAGQEIRDRNVVVLQVSPDSPADKAGLEVGDKIVSVNGVSFEDSQSVYDKLSDLKDESVEMKVLKTDDQEAVYTMQHEEIGENGEKMIGIGITETGVVDYGFFGSIWQGFKATGLMIVAIIKALVGLIVDLVTGAGLAPEFGGPIAVAAVTGKVVKLGFINVVYFAAVLSVNLGVINFFPFPALDGGRALFIAAEAITRRKLNEKVEGWIHNSGFIILILLLLLITLRDVQHYGSQIMEAVRNFF